MSPVELPTPAVAAPTSSPVGTARRLLRVVTLALLVVLTSFVASHAIGLWREYRALQVEARRVRVSVVVGYPGIMPRVSSARHPADWYHDEGAATALWGGWRQGAGHLWFHFERGDVVRSRISEPMGRDVIRAIDFPVVEQGGGRYWARIPDEADVVGSRLGGVDTVYPVIVLEKVLVINDVVGDRPFLIVASPYARAVARIAVYDPEVDGRRITLGLSGYFLEQNPLLYDRGTESLWVADRAGMRSIAGKLKGCSLPLVTRLTPSAWGDWRSLHPASRLVVGADRSKARPEL